MNFYSETCERVWLAANFLLAIFVGAVSLGGRRGDEFGFTLSRRGILTPRQDIICYAVFETSKGLLVKCLEI
uniref:UPF0126 domain-containing protein n=1 Tax=Loa loa TaxID=7209 RepID=A0A1I7VBL1_LOALO